MMKNDEVVKDIIDLQRHFTNRNGYIFTSIMEPSNVFDSIVIRNPIDCDCWSPKIGFSSKSIDDHIQHIAQERISKAFIIADSIDFIAECSSLTMLRVQPSDSAADRFDFSPLYEMNNICYLDCATSYGGCNYPKHTEIDYSHFPELKTLRVDGSGNLNYQSLNKLEYLNISNNKEYRSFPDMASKDSLKSISLFSCGIKNVHGICEYSNIEKIEFSYNRSLEDLSELNTISKSLKSLTIENCSKIKDFSFLEKLTGLRYLCLLGRNQLRNLEFIYSMPELEYFRFSMDVENGDLSPCIRIPKIYCMRHRRNYNMKL